MVKPKIFLVNGKLVRAVRCQDDKLSELKLHTSKILPKTAHSDIQTKNVKVNTEMGQGQRVQRKTGSSPKISTSVNNESNNFFQRQHFALPKRVNTSMEVGSLRTQGHTLKCAKEVITVIKWESPSHCNNTDETINTTISDDNAVKKTGTNLDDTLCANITNTCYGNCQVKNHRKKGGLTPKLKQPVVRLQKLILKGDSQSKSESKRESRSESKGKSESKRQGLGNKHQENLNRVSGDIEHICLKRKSEGCFVESSEHGMFLKKAEMTSDDDVKEENIENQGRVSRVNDDEDEIQKVIEGNIEEMLISEQTQQGEGFTYSLPYACGLCNYTAKLQHHLKNHMKTHASDRPFVCGVCGKAFKHAHHLAGHRRTHSGERPYSCDECGRRFTQISNLLRHRKTHQGPAQQNRHKCYQCDKNFSTAYSLRRHSAMHREVKARVKRIKNKAKKKKDFTYNPMVDDERRKFECDICGRKFTRKEHVLRHLLTHTGEPVYTCDVCGRGFNSKKALEKHIDIHTGDDFDVDDSDEEGSSSSFRESDSVTEYPLSSYHY